MRELKFRAFIDGEMVILENSGLQYFDFEGSYSLGFTVDGYSGFWAHEQYERATKESEKSPIMQFTGLKDKNGVDIYEGDIIEWFDDETKTVLRSDIYFNVCCFSMKTSSASTVTFINGNMSEYSVIGNIYQNPEILPNPLKTPSNE